MAFIIDALQDSILDLSWSTDGYILMACSGDGSVVFIQFTEEDIGIPLSEFEKNALYQRMYGKSMSDMNATSDKDLIVENAELLNSSMDGGKRTITKPIPTFLSPDVVMKNDFVRQQPKPAEMESREPQTVSSPMKQAIHKQIETRTKDGKRRITPMFIPLTQDCETEPTGGALAEIQSSSGVSTKIVVEQIKSPERFAFTDTNYAKQTPPTVQEKMDCRLSKASNAPPAKTGSSLNTTTTTTETSVPPSAVQPKPQLGRNLLVSGKPDALQNGVSRSVGQYRVVAINNFLKLSSNPIHRVSCFQNDMKTALWQNVTSSAVCTFNTCLKYVLVACLDGTVRFLDIRTGCLVLPIMTMATAVVQSAFNLVADPEEELAGVVTEAGVVRVWDIGKQKVKLSVTCSDLLRTTAANQPSISILMMTLANNGVPFIVLGNGTSYCYSVALDSWLVLNGKDLLQQRSLIKYAPTTSLNPNTIIQKDMKRYPLTSVQTTVLSMIPSAAVAAHINSSTANSSLKEWESLSQLAFIENQIRLCEAIHSPEELKYWYSTLGYHLAVAGTEVRLRMLLDDLLGPLYTTTAQQEQRTILVSVQGTVV